jgi:hypothetical protein
MMARVLRQCRLKKGHCMLEAGEQMIADLISYGLLASIFVVTGLRMFVEKPNKVKELPLAPWRRKRPNSRDA